MSVGLRNLVDGRGAERVVRLFQAAKVSLRRVAQDDCALLWQWANDPDVRRWSFHSDPIPWDDHILWFESKCGKPECIWYIACDAHQRPVGQLRIDLDAPLYGTVDISVAPEARGQGLATSMLCAALDQGVGAAVIGEVHAYVKPGNAASLRSFERAGFTSVGMATAEGMQAIHFVCRPSEAQATGQSCRDGAALGQRI
jgi:RimJ/RimL family protein N-acetyltransferase